MQRLSLALLATVALTTLAAAATLTPQTKNNSLILYSANIGLVHEQRGLEVAPSDTSIIYKNVAKNIDIDSINVTLPEGIKINSQHYRYDKLTLKKLLETHIGKKIEVRMLRNRNEFKIISATLLSFDRESALVRTLDYKIITVKNSEILFSEIPKELITTPSLLWDVKVDKEQKADMQLEYLVKNISFTSHYLLNLDANTSTLTGWVSVNNHSGKRFEHTKLSLLAGDIHINRAAPFKHIQRAATLMQNSPNVKHQAVEGYHFYTIASAVTLANNEKTQIKFLEERNITTQRVYSATLSSPLSLSSEHKVALTQAVKLQGIDKALPKGVVSVYTTLKKQRVLLGEDSIRNTPKNRPLELQFGKNFDLLATERLLKRQDTKELYNADISYSIHNSSDAAKTVTLFIPFHPQESSHITTDERYRLTQGNLVAFTLNVDANSTKEFTVNYESTK